MREARFLYRVGHDNITAYFLDEDEFLDQDDDEIDDDALGSKQVGKLDVTSDDDGNIWLDQVEVDEDSRGRGVGTEMLRRAVQELGLSHIACVTEADAYKLSLTPAGESLIVRCLRKEIVTPDMCYFSSCGGRPSRSFILEGGEADPGYDSARIIATLEYLKKHPPLRQTEITEYFPVRRQRVTSIAPYLCGVGLFAIAGIALAAAARYDSCPEVLDNLLCDGIRQFTG